MLFVAPRFLKHGLQVRFPLLIVAGIFGEAGLDDGVRRQIEADRARSVEREGCSDEDGDEQAKIEACV